MTIGTRCWHCLKEEIFETVDLAFAAGWQRFRTGSMIVWLCPGDVVHRARLVEATGAEVVEGRIREQ